MPWQDHASIDGNDRMRRVLLPAGCLAHSAESQEARYEVKVVADRQTAIYQTGEKAVFRISVTCDGPPVTGGSVSFVIDDFIVDNPPIDDYPRGSVTLHNGTASVTASASRPLFLRCRVTFETPAKRKLQDTAGAGFSPQEIHPSLPVPDDFDRFWNEQKQRLATIAPDPKLTDVPRPGLTGWALPSA